MYLGLKIRIYPNKAQRKIIDEHIEGAIYVYNYFLHYAKEEKNYDIAIWRKELFGIMKRGKCEVLNNCDYFLLLNQLDILKNSYDNYFKGLGNEPNFKKKDANVSAFKIANRNNSISLNDNRLFVQLLGNLKCRYNKDISNCKIYSVVIKRSLCNIYEASLLYDAIVPYLEKKYRKIGIDIGVRKLITTSEGDYYIPISTISNIDSFIKGLQKKLSGKEMHSNNWYKWRRKIEKLHLYRSNYIKDILNKATTKLVQDYDVIFMEDLSITELLKQQKVKTIKRRVVESSLYTIRDMLTYKCKMYGKKLVLIDRYYPSSKICSECGYRHDPLDLEIFRCPVCGLVIDRDLNAAKNIYKYGMLKYIQNDSTVASTGNKPIK